MDIAFESIMNYSNIFILVLIRITALFIISPVFGRKNTPTIFKICFGLFLTLIIAPTIDVNTLNEVNSILEYTLLVFNEFIIGLILGFVTYITFSTLYIAGQIIDMEMGFGMVNVIDPQSNIQIPVVANFYNTIAMLMFLSLNGHHMIVSSIFHSYKVLPIGTTIVAKLLTDDIVRMFADMFIIGFKVAGPVIAAIFITNIALGILARTVPQINIFVLGIPIKIFVGLGVLVLVIPMFSVIMDIIISDMYGNLDTIIKGMIAQ